MDKIRVTGIKYKPVGHFTRGKEYQLHVWHGDGDDLYDKDIIGGVYDDIGVFIQIYATEDPDIEYMIVT